MTAPLPSGSPIRVPRDRRPCAPPPGLSRLAAPFVVSLRQGIRRAPCISCPRSPAGAPCDYPCFSMYDMMDVAIGSGGTPLAGRRHSRFVVCRSSHSLSDRKDLLKVRWRIDFENRLVSVGGIPPERFLSISRIVSCPSGGYPPNGSFSLCGSQGTRGEPRGPGTAGGAPQESRAGFARPGHIGIYDSKVLAS